MKSRSHTVNKVSKGFAVMAFSLCLALKSYAADVGAYSHVMINEPTVKMGNVFTNVSAEDSNIDLFKAPEVGKKFTLTFEWLEATAKKYGYTFVTTSGKGVTVVERTTDIVRGDEVSSFIAKNIIQQGYLSDVVIELDNKTLEVPIARGLEKTFYLNNLHLDKINKKFSADLELKQDETHNQRLMLTGRFEPLIKVPVVAEQKIHGDNITKDDINYISMRADSLGSQYISTADKLVGMTPKRAITADSPIRLNEIQTPVLVKKNDTVTVVLNNGSMSIAMKGRALEDGSKGDIVRIINPTSKREIEGVVTGLSTVQVENNFNTTKPIAENTFGQGFTN